MFYYNCGTAKNPIDINGRPSAKIPTLAEYAMAKKDFEKEE